jgi:multidrug resistance efflux pump
MRAHRRTDPAQQTTQSGLQVSQLKELQIVKPTYGGLDSNSTVIQISAERITLRLVLENCLTSENAIKAIAKGKYAGAEARVSYSEIRSPIDGVVTDRSFSP